MKIAPATAAAKGLRKCGSQVIVLAEQSALAQIIQHQRIKRHRRAGEQIRSAATAEIILQAQAIGVRFFLYWAISG